MPLDAPWTAPRAAEWDARSVASWLEHSGIRTTIARDLFESAVRGLMTADLSEASLLHLLYLAHAHGSIDTLFSIENGAQENMVDGGAGSIARRVADELGGSIRLSTPVRAITQRDDHVLVAGDELTVVGAKRRGVGAAGARARDRVRPAASRGPAGALPRRHRRLGDQDDRRVRRAVLAGRRLQRPDGRAGIGRRGHAGRRPLVRESGRHRGVHVRAGRRSACASLDAGVRRKAVLDALAARLGPRAANPAEFIETSWWTEEWSRGCSMAHFTLGTLTRYGHLLREPFGRVHWAGTETATISHGAIDGAVRSGERVAAEILGGD